MMAKITKNNNCQAIINYILDDRKHTKLLYDRGVRNKDPATIAKSFEIQSRLNPNVTNKIGHISLAFSARDIDKLNDSFLILIAKEYLEQMNIKDTQYIIGRHFDKEHPHIHIAFNRINNRGQTISDKNDRYRSEKICKQLTFQHGLYFSGGKEAVKVDRLREPDKTKYKLYNELTQILAMSHDWSSFLAETRRRNIQVSFKYRGNTQEVQGIVFEKNNYRFNGSKIDRMFSYSKIDKVLAKQKMAEGSCVTCSNGMTPSLTLNPISFDKNSFNNQCINLAVDILAPSLICSTGGEEDPANKKKRKR